MSIFTCEIRDCRLVSDKYHFQLLEALVDGWASVIFGVEAIIFDSLVLYEVFFLQVVLCLRSMIYRVSTCDCFRFREYNRKKAEEQKKGAGKKAEEESKSSNQTPKTQSPAAGTQSKTIPVISEEVTVKIQTSDHLETVVLTKTSGSKI
jgi:hypothetical protein